MQRFTNADLILRDTGDDGEDGEMMIGGLPPQQLISSGSRSISQRASTNVAGVSGAGKPTSSKPGLALPPPPPPPPIPHRHPGEGGTSTTTATGVVKRVRFADTQHLCSITFIEPRRLQGDTETMSAESIPSPIEGSSQQTAPDELLVQPQEEPEQQDRLGCNRRYSQNACSQAPPSFYKGKRSLFETATGKEQQASSTIAIHAPPSVSATSSEEQRAALLKAIDEAIETPPMEPPVVLVSPPKNSLTLMSTVSNSGSLVPRFCPLNNQAETLIEEAVRKEDGGGSVSSASATLTKSTLSMASANATGAESQSSVVSVTPQELQMAQYWLSKPTVARSTSIINTDASTNDFSTVSGSGSSATLERKEATIAQRGAEMTDDDEEEEEEDDDDDDDEEEAVDGEVEVEEARDPTQRLTFPSTTSGTVSSTNTLGASLIAEGGAATLECGEDRLGQVRAEQHSVVPVAFAVEQFFFEEEEGGGGTGDEEQDAPFSLFCQKRRGEEATSSSQQLAKKRTRKEDGHQLADDEDEVEILEAHEETHATEATEMPTTTKMSESQLAEQDCVFCHQPECDHWDPGTHFPMHADCALYCAEIHCDPMIGQLVNVRESLQRVRRIKCVVCREFGAGVGCLDASCQRSYHVHCMHEETLRGGEADVVGEGTAKASKKVIPVPFEGCWCPLHGPNGKARKKQKKPKPGGVSQK